MKRSKFSEEQVPYALRQAGGWDRPSVTSAAAGHQRGDVLCLEGALRAPRRARGPACPAARRGECAAQAPGRRSHARQAHAGGGGAPKRMTPARRRELAAWFQATFQISCRRACCPSVAPAGRSSRRARPSRGRNGGCSACVGAPACGAAGGRGDRAGSSSFNGAAAPSRFVRTACSRISSGLLKPTPLTGC